MVPLPLVAGVVGGLLVAAIQIWAYPSNVESVDPDAVVVRPGWIMRVHAVLIAVMVAGAGVLGSLAGDEMRRICWLAIVAFTLAGLWNSFAMPAAVVVAPSGMCARWSWRTELEIPWSMVSKVSFSMLTGNLAIRDQNDERIRVPFVMRNTDKLVEALRRHVPEEMVTNALGRYQRIRDRLRGPFG